MRRLAFAVLLLASLSALAEKPKLISLGLLIPKTLDAATGAAMSDAIAELIAKKGYFEVVSSKDVETMLGLERQKQLLGCGEESSSCLAELSGALGARFVLSGTLAQLGESWQLSLQMQDTSKGQIAGRSTRIAKALPALRVLLPWMVAEATRTPVPPPPSKTWPTVLLVGGGLFALSGAFSGVTALNTEAAFKHELSRGETTPGLLSPVAVYQAKEDEIRLQKNGALLGFGLGVAALALGYYLWPIDPMQQAGLAVVPTGNGLAVAGAF